MGRGERNQRIGSKNNSKRRGRKKDVKSDDSDEDYMLEEDEADNLSDELDSLVGDASDEESLGSFVDKEEKEKVRDAVKTKSGKRSIVKRNNGRTSRKRRRIYEEEDDDADYENEEEDDDNDNCSYGGGTSTGRFVNEVEEETERELVWPKSHKRTTGRRKKRVGSVIKREIIANEEDDKDYEEDNDVYAGTIGGNGANLDGFVEEEEEERVREAERPISWNRSSGKRENWSTSSRQRKSIVKDEEYYEEDNDADSGSMDAGDSYDVDEEESIRISETCNRSSGKRRNTTTSSRPRNRIVDDEDYNEDEDNDAVVGSSDGGRKVQNGIRSSRNRKRIVDDGEYNEEEEEENDGGSGERQNGTRSSRQRKRIVDDEDYCEEDNDAVDQSIEGGDDALRAADCSDGGSYHDDDEEEEEEEDYEDEDEDEFTPEELDFLDEEEENLTPKEKRGSVRSRNGKTGVKLSKKPQKNKRQRSSSSSKLASSRNRKSVKKVGSSRGKCKRKLIHRRKKTKACSDSDFAISEPSDYEFTISEEEREQVREANEFCRRSSNPKSSKQDREDAAAPKKIPRRKGKEKVDEVKSDVGKQVCGICLTEEGKNTIRGTLDCCSHFFCFPCIMEWSKVESRCPLCKQRFYTISKSTRSSTRIDLRNVVIHVPERDQVYQPSEEELRDYLDSYENVFCTECHEGGDDALMLLCDLCNSPSHTYCVGLGREVPDGNWYCEGCRPSALGLSTTSQTQELTPTQRSNNISLTEPTFENMAEIDLNITVPETPMTPPPLNDFLVSPRQPPSGANLQAPSPVSSVGVSTLYGRRRMYRMQYLLSSNRLSPMGGSTTEVGSSYNAEYLADRLQENPFSSALNRGSFNGRLSLMRGQPQQPLQAPFIADNSELNNSMPLQPCTSTSTSSFLNQNVVEQQLQSLVKTHVVSLCRDINLELGRETFKQIILNSTHTILAASRLPHSRAEVVHEIQPPNCCHAEALIIPQTSLIKGCCQACFDSFVRYVVMTITMGCKTKPPEQLTFRNY